MGGEWREARLGQLGEVNRGRSRHRPRDAAHLYGGAYPFIQTGDIKASGGRITSHSQTYSEAGLAQSRLWPEGTMVITIAANIAETAILTYPACFPDSVVGFVADKRRADVRFVEYLFRHLRRQIQHENVGTGSVQDNINLQTLARLTLRVPEPHEQRAIAHILGTLDDKIENNRKMAKTLEAMAQAIFQSWFVDFDPVRAKVNGESPESICQRLKLTPEILDLFPDRLVDSELGEIPEGWGMQRVSDYMSLAYGKSLPAGKRHQGSVPVYGSGGITGFHNKAIVNGPTVIVGRKGTVGSLYWEDRPCFPIDTVFYVQPEAPLPFCYYLLEDLPLREMNTDAAVPGLNRENVYRLKVVAPPTALIAAFAESTSRFRNIIAAVSRDSETLAKIRDTLLPKLISGEIRVSESKPLSQDAMEIVP
ncbi:restriction endonuclease subunit S [Acidithiobacillus sp. M4-SHS-6]|uniref:restriction endonuclease subunit S n=1 Tax=Acidithiobacillus sp. M4-SHS-6 TaxID=3383024 RepID=UPI0039BE1D8D